MKPDWRNAPAWATVLAQDISGYWYWYEEAPTMTKTQYFVRGKRAVEAGFSERSLTIYETRPKEVK